MSPSYSTTDYLLDRANIHDTVTKLVGHILTTVSPPSTFMNLLDHM